MGGGDIASQVDQGMSIGISASNSYGFANNRVGTQALYANVSAGIARRRQAYFQGDVCGAADALLTDEERNQLQTPK